jgi:uncharacterized membrane protein SpoIIM required for sporulation
VHIDDFIARNEPTWARLRALTKKAGRRGRGLSPDELDDLVRLYQRVSTHLSLARSRYGDQGLVASLTGLVARTGAIIYGTRPRTLRVTVRFFTETFPAALWHLRRFVAVAFLLFAVPGLAAGLWVGNDPAALEATGPQEFREEFVGELFEDYYTELASAEFAATVTTNNINVGLFAFAGGILLCVPTAFVLAFNGLNVGVAWGLFIAAGDQARFWSLILPHGLLELTAIFVAGGTGLALGWTLVDPGDRRRGEALVAEGRRTVVVLMGLVLMFVAAGLIEGFVTGAAIHPWLRVAIGAAVWALFLGYVAVCGRAAAARGLTGAMGEQSDRGWARPDGRPPGQDPAGGYSRPAALTSR